MRHDKAAQQQMTAWWQTTLGKHVIAAEKNWLQRHAAGFTGHFQIQLGGGEKILPAFSRPCYQSWLDEQGDCLADSHYLPLKSDTVDQLILMHMLEFNQNPHQLLREADRVLAEDGTLVLFAFNPLSLWGLRKLFSWRQGWPWSGHFFTRWRLIDWLTLLDFEVVERRAIFFRLPVKPHPKLPKLAVLEKIGSRFWPYFGGITLLVAKKRSIIVTPLRNQWQQKSLFPGAGLRSRPIARQGQDGSR